MDKNWESQVDADTLAYIRAEARELGISVDEVVRRSPLLLIMPLNVPDDGIYDGAENHDRYLPGRKERATGAGAG